MLLLRFINIILFLGIFLPGFSQSDTARYIKSVYREEGCSWFQFQTFDRGIPIDSTRFTLDSLAAKPKRNWTRTDSLIFARTSLRTGNYELAEHYYDQLQVNYKTEEHFWWNHLMLHVSLKRFEEAVDIIHATNEGILEHSELFFVHNILDAEYEQSKNNKWYKTHSIFNWVADSTIKPDKNNQVFVESVVEPLKNLSNVLKRLVRYIHEDDPILSRAFCEMGEIFFTYKNYSNAYISFSIGRHYNHKDKNILNKIKLIKAQLIRKKYKIPNFRKYFPRIEFYRFDYEVLKEQLIAADNDTTALQKPLYMVKAEERELPFRVELIYIVGIGLMFILILIFVRPIDRNRKKIK